jgi:hypothetical protein
MHHRDPTHWYDRDCCNLKDCRPAEPGELKWTPDGWLHVPSNTITLEKFLRPIPDHAPEDDKFKMHVCILEYGDDFEGRFIQKGAPRCIYKGASGT